MYFKIRLTSENIRKIDLGFKINFQDESGGGSSNDSDDGTGATFHPPITSFCKLNVETNLNPPPSNWLMSGARGQVPPGVDQLAGFDPSNHSTGFSSFRMASHFLECLGLDKFGVDVVSDAENIKKLLRMPYSKNAVSMVIVNLIIYLKNVSYAVRGQ